MANQQNISSIYPKLDHLQSTQIPNNGGTCTSEGMYCIQGQEEGYTGQTQATTIHNVPRREQQARGNYDTHGFIKHSLQESRMETDCTSQADENAVSVNLSENALYIAHVQKNSRWPAHDIVKENETLKQQIQKYQVQLESLRDLRVKNEQLMEKDELLLQEKEKLKQSLSKQVKIQEENQWLQNEKEKLEQITKENTEIEKEHQHLQWKKKELAEALQEYQQNKSPGDMQASIAKKEKWDGHCISGAEYEKVKEEYIQMINELLSTHDKENQELAATKEAVDILQKEYRDLSDRLAAEMNSKLSTSETCIPNTGMENRPLKIVEEYANFCSEHWLTAKTHLDEKFTQTPNQQKVSFLLDIIQFAQQKSQAMHYQILQDIYNILNNPLNPKMVINANKKESTASQRSEGKVNNMQESVSNVINDYLMSSCDIKKLEPLVKDVLKELAQKHPKAVPWMSNDEVILSYIQKTIQLTWKMVNQRPAMEFKAPGTGSPFQDHIQEAQFGSDNPKDKRACVLYYVHPVLFQGHNVMTKGKVMVKYAA